jgi:hypothetical protein
MLALTTKTIQFKDIDENEVTVLEHSLIEVLPETDEFGLYVADYYGRLFTISLEEFRLLC